MKKIALVSLGLGLIFLSQRRPKTLTQHQEEILPKIAPPSPSNRPILGTNPCYPIRTLQDTIIDPKNNIRAPKTMVSCKDVMACPSVSWSLWWLESLYQALVKTGIYQTSAYEWYYKKVLENRKISEKTVAEMFSNFLIGVKEDKKELEALANTIEKSEPLTAVISISKKVVSAFISWVNQVQNELELDDFYAQLLDIIKVLGPMPTALFHFFAHFDGSFLENSRTFTTGVSEFFQNKFSNTRTPTAPILLKIVEARNFLIQEKVPIQEIHKAFSSPSVFVGTTLEKRANSYSLQGKLTDYLSFFGGYSWETFSKSTAPAEIFFEYGFFPDLFLWTFDTLGKRYDSAIKAYRDQIHAKNYHNYLGNWFRFDLDDWQSMLARMGWTEEEILTPRSPQFTIGYDYSYPVNGLHVPDSYFQKRVWVDTRLSVIPKEENGQKIFLPVPFSGNWFISRPDPVNHVDWIKKSVAWKLKKEAEIIAQKPKLMSVSGSETDDQKMLLALKHAITQKYGKVPTEKSIRLYWERAFWSHGKRDVSVEEVLQEIAFNEIFLDFI